MSEPGARDAGGYPLAFGAYLRGRREQDGDALRLVLRGEFDLTAVDRVTAELHRMEQRRPAAIIVDLGEVVVMDSKALEAMMAATFRAQERGHRLAIRDAVGVATRVIELAGVRGILDLE